MNISFHGAARSVTGSRHLLEVNHQKVLLDCGLMQGHGAFTVAHNHLDFDPRGLNAVVLSHAHIDHSGALPLLVRMGYTGPIYATPATAELTAVMLQDSASLQEQDAHEFNMREQLEGPDARQPLYTVADALQAASQFVTHPYGAPFEINSSIRAQFRDAGHILGSAFVEMHVSEGGAERTVVFSGDIGRANQRVVRAPDPPKAADILIMESTYGDRDHPPQTDTEKTLGELVSYIAAHGGKLLIPAFAIGRTQQITYMLNDLWNRSDIPEVPIFVDSPLALKATEVFRWHPELWPESTTRELKEARDHDPFGFETLHYVQSPQESRELDDYIGPAIIVAASGMCEGGRIVHHLAHHLHNPHNAVLLVGYQAEGTLGRRLQDGERNFTIMGKEVERRATVLHMSGFSAHAGRTELEAFYAPLAKQNKELFIVHGEPGPAESFASWARLQTSGRVTVPGLGQHFDV